MLKILLKTIFFWDPTARFELLTKIGKILVPDYRFKWPQMEWWKDKKFNTYLEKFLTDNEMNLDRKWMVSELLRFVDSIEGDTAECGVFNGSTSYLICQANETSSFEKKHYGFDSFEGLSEPLKNDGNYWKTNDLSISEKIATQNLSCFKKVSLLKGWIPQKFKEVENHSFSFVHIDVDIYQPTKDSIEFFYPRMTKGAILVCDDYGFTTCPGATQAIDEFLKDKKEKMIRLSGGGGFFIKGQKTKP